MSRVPTPMAEALVWPMSKAPAMSGLSRTTLYRAATAGEITLLKCGRSTLVDVASVRAYLARLPQLKPKVAA